MGEAVIIGMPGAWADDTFEAADHYTTKIGGLPDWPPCVESVIRPDLLRCDSCGDNLCLVAQIYAPISSKILTVEERVIYIFACVAPTCKTNGWRVLRVQKPSHNKEPEPLSHDSSASPFKTKVKDDDPWSFDFDDDEDDGFDLEELGKALIEATTLASASKTKKPNTCPDAIDKCSPISQRSRPLDDKTAVLPCFYIYTQDENYSKDVISMSTSLSSLDIEENQGDGAAEEAWEGERYEYDKALNADRTYLKFKKRLDVYPEQCFRYSFGGKPLLATTEAGDPGRCVLCGELRLYEMQLMPPLLYYLQEATKNINLEKWNWMTLIVYTCSKGCAPASKQESDGWIVAEEVIVVQTE